MSSSVADVLERPALRDDRAQTCAVIADARVNPDPFPRMYVRDVFPRALYRQMLDNLPAPETYTGTSYEHRYFCAKETMREGFWADIADWLTGDVAQAILRQFKPDLRARFGGRPVELLNDCRLIMDRDGYEIKPHTDHPDKVISFLFYLARDESMADLGTAIYRPKDPAFECMGKARHAFDLFDQVWRAPLLPNSGFGFFKTPKAFHGVPAIERAGMRRDVLLVNIYYVGEGSTLQHLIGAPRHD